jgi:hypothetical protein
MIVKILGLIDIIAGFLIILLKWELFPYLALLIGLSILVKALLFFTSDTIVSMIDIFCVCFLFLGLIGVYFYFTWLFSIWFFQKGFFSLAA